MKGFQDFSYPILEHFEARNKWSTKDVSYFGVKIILSLLWLDFRTSAIISHWVVMNNTIEVKYTALGV